MFKKLNSLKTSVFLIFVLTSALMSGNGGVYGQVNSNEPSNINQSSVGPNVTNSNGINSTESAEVELPSTLNEVGNVQSVANGSSVDETTEHNENSNNASAGVITRDSQTVLLEGVSMPAGSYLHLYDSTPYQINSGHVAAKVPCGEDNQTSINILLGKAPDLTPAELEYIAPLSDPGNLCLYHADVVSSEDSPMTDIAIQNNSTEDVDFPGTSTIVLGVNEIAPLASEGHDEG